MTERNNALFDRAAIELIVNANVITSAHEYAALPWEFVSLMGMTGIPTEMI